MNNPKHIRYSVRNCFGFTLVELLVVIAIIGVLVGITLPAVQSVREAARRSQCSNHLKQMGLAFHSYHDSHQAFPTGGWVWFRPPNYASGIPLIGAKQHGGWGFQILPYVEAKNVYDSDALTAIGSPNQVFFCPSRPRPLTVVGLDNYFPAFGVANVTRALCDYAGSNRDGTGPLRPIEPLSFADITDGTSNTLLLGDKRLNTQHFGELQDDDNEGYTAGFNEDTIRRTDRPPAPDYAAEIGDGEKIFGSSHPAILNITLTDASVRSIPFEIDSDVFEKLGDRSDGENVSFSP